MRPWIAMILVGGLLHLASAPRQLARAQVQGETGDEQPVAPESGDDYWTPERREKAKPFPLPTPAAPPPVEPPSGEKKPPVGSDGHAPTAEQSPEVER